MDMLTPPTADGLAALPSARPPLHATSGAPAMRSSMTSTALADSGYGSASTARPTNAFHGLVAWFSNAVHPTAVYTWTLHQGRLANLSGIETGDYPVDVIFSRPGDALLQRLPDLSIDVLDAKWIKASLNSGKLVPLASFRLQTLCRSSSAKLDRTNECSPTPSRTLNNTQLNHVTEDVPKEEPAPPSPQSLPFLDKLLLQSEVSQRGSQLSPRRPSSTPQRKSKGMDRMSASSCHISCPELFCSHRPDFNPPKKVKKHEAVRFPRLTRMSPVPKRQKSHYSPYLPVGSKRTTSYQDTALSQTAKTSASSTDQRLARIKSEIEVFKSPSYKPAIVKSESPQNIYNSPSKQLNRSANASPLMKTETTAELHDTKMTSSLTEDMVAEYRKAYGAPKIVAETLQENSMIVDMRVLPAGLVSLKSEEDDRALACPSTPCT